MKIELKDNLIPVEIGNLHFKIDADDVNKHIVVDEFIRMYSGERLITDTFINDCKRVINTLLGEGAYKKLFKKDDLKPYYVILQLADAITNAFEDSAMTDKMRKDREAGEKEMQRAQKILEGMSEFNNQLNYASSKYGTRNVASQRRSTKHNKYRNN